MLWTMSSRSRRSRPNLTTHESGPPSFLMSRTIPILTVDVFAHRPPAQAFRHRGLKKGSVMKSDTRATATVGIVLVVASLTVTWASRSDALESDLVRCVDVTQPATLANCGTAAP